MRKATETVTVNIQYSIVTISYSLEFLEALFKVFGCIAQICDKKREMKDKEIENNDDH